MDTYAKNSLSSPAATYAAEATAAYSCSGPLPAPELAWFWDGQSELTLQIANSKDFTYSAMPDSVPVTLTGPDGTQSAQFGSSLSDVTVDGLTAGEYALQAEAASGSTYVTTSSAEAERLAVSLGEEESASDDYAAPQGGFGGPDGGDGWDVKPESISFEEGSASFAFSIGDPDFLHATANLYGHTGGRLRLYLRPGQRRP